MTHPNLLSDQRPDNEFWSKRHELLVEKLMEFYYWEMKMLEMLPKMQTASGSMLLQKKIAIYHAKKGEQIEYLQQVFILIDQPIAGKKSTLVELLLEECEKLTAHTEAANDQKIFSMLLTLSHFNQTSYNFLISLAPVVNFKEINECILSNLFIEQDLVIKMIEILTD